ncbi:MAG: hypothetical protein LC114_04250 [Bryobacterales bacterium]|nr:hypothetical protein [Bryobacterales bacterium]
MTTITITLREVFPEAGEDDICMRFDAEVDIDGTKWTLTDAVGIVAGFRQDMLEPGPASEQTPEFPLDLIWIPVTGTDYDDEPERLELLCDAGWTALLQWHSANAGDPTSGLPFTQSIEYHG